MTEPSYLEPDRPADPHADREPEVKPEVISDLDVPSDDAEHVAGASLIRCETR